MRFLPFILIPVLLGCTELHEEESVHLVFGCSGTKAAVVDDSSIHSLDLFLYRAETGALETHLRSDSFPLSVDVPKSILLECFFIVNAPEGIDPGLRSRMEDNTKDALVMSFHSFKSFEKSSFVDVTLDRLMSRVVLGEVIPSQGFRRAWLKNVAATCPYTLMPEIGCERFNVSSPDACLNPFLKECTLSYNNGNCEFFCYPDPDGTCSLIVEFDAPYGVDSYSVPLPPMNCNTTYRIRKLMISDRKELEFTISVSPWEEVDSSCTLE